MNFLGRRTGNDMGLVFCPEFTPGIAFDLMIDTDHLIHHF